MFRRLLLAAAPLIAACTVVKTDLRSELSGVPPGKGIVVFSTGADSKSGSSPIALDFETAGTKGTTNTDIYMNALLASSQFPDEHGHVRMLALDAGTYCFRPRSGNPYLKLTGPLPAVAFRVQPGAISYIGSIFLVGGSSFKVRDRQQRDVAAFVAQNPAFSSQPVTVAPARILSECRSL